MTTTIQQKIEKTTYVGIDYSMSSPALAIYRGEPKDFSWEKVKFHYFTKDSKFARQWKHIDLDVWCTGYKSDKDEYLHNEERFAFLSTWAGCLIAASNGFGRSANVKCAIEDYAMGARGRVFEIAENTGCLKQYLRQREYDFVLYPPTVVKKFATGKGNSDKNKMYEAWMDETGFDIWQEMTPGRTKISSPVTDIVDAYFILKKLVKENQA